MSIIDIINAWRKEAKIPYEASVILHRHDDTLFIISKYPGYFIGFKGILHEKYVTKLEENGYNYKISYIDTFVERTKEF